MRILLLILAMLAAPLAARAQSAIPVLISTDIGNEVDDQWPLIHLLMEPRFEVLGVASAHAPAENIPGPAAETSATLIRQIVEDRLGLARHPPLLVGSNTALADERTPISSEAAQFILEQSRGFSSRRRLNLLVTGAATDAASALLLDPSLADRVTIVAMGFQSWSEGGTEFNIRNDPKAWRVILASRVPVVVGAADVTSRDLGLSQVEAAALLADAGPLQRWLLRDFNGWFEQVARNFEHLKRPGGAKAWPIWDHVVVAHLLGLTATRTYPRPQMGEDLKFKAGNGGPDIVWVTEVKREPLFSAFRKLMVDYSRRNAVKDPACYTFARDPLSCWRTPLAR
jgi:inosine-uridine nucleoside N-ribohydrolase